MPPTRRSASSNPKPQPSRKRPAKAKTGMSAACARGSHSVCSGLVQVWPPTPGKRFHVCTCPTCDHPGTTTTPR